MKTAVKCSCYNYVMNKAKVYGRACCYIVTTLALIGSILFLYQSTVVEAASQTKQGDITVSGLVGGPPPSMAPTIDYPTNNTTFDVKHITVTGECIAGYVVKLFRNNVFVGSTICRNDGRYSLPIDLAINRNDLIARQYDSTNQASPESAQVTVYYIPRSPETILPGGNPEDQQRTGSEPVGIANFQLSINYDYTLQGIFAGQPFRLPVSFGGGTPPYAVSIEWGDSTSSLFSRQDASQFPTEHTYSEAGFKTVIVKVSDAKGDEAYLQFVILVNGGASPVVERLLGDSRLVELWPVVALVGSIVGVALGIWGTLTVQRMKRKKHTS